MDEMPTLAELGAARLEFEARQYANDLLTQAERCEANPETFCWAIAGLVAERERLRQALERSVVAIDDWLHSHAPDMCNDEVVAASRKRVSEHGTLWYIADVQQQNRAALSPSSPEGSK